MKRIACFLFLLNILVFADDFVWKDADSFRNMQKNLQELMRASGSNERLNALWESASRISQMNDRCSSISLNDILDEECGHYYKVELPKFEKEFQRVSGEIRLNALSIQSDVSDQLKKLKACSEALDVFYVAEAQLRTIKVDSLKTRPMDLSGKTYEVSYSFGLINDEDVLQSLSDMARKWANQCAGVVIENYELFEDLVDQMNVDMALHKKLSTSLQIDEARMSFYLKHNAGGYYEFGNAKICSTSERDHGRYLIIDLEKDRVETVRGGPSCSGKDTLETGKSLWGRWVWNSEVVNCSAVFFRGSKDYWNCMSEKKEK